MGGGEEGEERGVPKSCPSGRYCLYYKGSAGQIERIGVFDGNTPCVNEMGNKPKGGDFSNYCCCSKTDCPCDPDAFD